MIKNMALNNLHATVVQTLTRIINGCFRIAYFPDPWKCIAIITTLKPGKNLRKPSNYRFIATLLHFKIFQTHPSSYIKLCD